MRKVVKPSFMAKNSVDLFDGDLIDEFGGMLCVAIAIQLDKVDEYWRDYVKKSGFAM